MRDVCWERVAAAVWFGMSVVSLVAVILAKFPR